jgi:Fe2+ transport system protein B
LIKSPPIAITIATRRGAIKGWRGFVWMLKIILPVSLATFLLDFSGWIHRLDGMLEPLMGAIHLPAMAALPLLAGMLTGIYGAIAAMSILPFTADQMTLMAVFLLIAHSLIQEGIVQHQSGCPAWLATMVRLTAAVLTVLVLGWILPPETAHHLAGTSAMAPKDPFWPALAGWAAAMAILCLKILVIITVLMIFMEILKQFHLIDRMMRVIEPLMGVLGLEREVGMLWLTAVIFGITYGGAVIVEEARERRLTAQQLKTLHVSIGINHAMVEDPALFLPLGIHPFWLWIPRLATAVIFTAIYRLWRWTRRHRRNEAYHLPCPDVTKDQA